jgi:arylamine N-acetyltransferase
MFRRFFYPLLITCLLLSGCVSSLQRKEQYLREAGFKAITPTTPAQIAKVQSLPQGHLRQYTRKGHTYFVLADAKKNLLLVGNNARFERYQQILYTKKVDPAIAQEQADRMIENDWGGWDGMMDPFFFGGPMFW